MPKFRKKPVIIEAIQWTNAPDNFTKILEWSSGKVSSASPLIWPARAKDAWSCLQIETMEGCMLANLNDWIIRGVSGEYYPCKPDIFNKTYEKIEE